jgi:hypothetical protein
VVLICALAFVYAGQVWKGIRASLRAGKWKEGRGRIIDLKEPWWLTAPLTKRFPRFESRTIDVVFEYEYEGTRYGGTKIAVDGLYVTNLAITRLYRELAKASRGASHVTIWINPASPEEAVLLRQNDKFAIAGGGFIVFMISVVSALVFL